MLALIHNKHFTFFNLNFTLFRVNLDLFASSDREGHLSLIGFLLPFPDQTRAAV